METNKILEQELSKLGRNGEEARGSVGAAVAAKFLPSVDFQHTVLYNASPENAIKSAYAVITNMDGYQRMMNVGSDLNNPALSAVIGSGFKNMNPAIVFLAFEAVDAMATNIHISGSAKEGLIKQKTAQKVVMRIAEELQNRSK